MNDWRPVASSQAIRARAELLADIRQFFAARQVIEVETPLLSAYGVTDVHLQNLTTRFADQTLYLQTSPEYAMKRILASGVGDIYQITKAFRDDEQGRFHNPEFTLLEWYRIGLSDQQLMDEISALISNLLACPPPRRCSYQSVFIECLGVDPLADSAPAKLRQRLKQEPVVADLASTEDDFDTLLQLAMSVLIEPTLSNQFPVFVYDFPVSQAALAQTSTTDPRTAKRFELYYQGVELANGFVELTDATTQRARFNRDNEQRIAQQRELMAIDERLLAALTAGMPACAGVALGIDRLLMLQQGASSIEQVLAFPVRCA